MMRVSCGKCKKTLAVPPDKVGKQVKCPGCGNIFAVSGGGAAKAVPAKPAPAKAVKPAGPTTHKNLWADDEESQGSYALGVDVGPKDAEAIRDDRVDEMVVNAQRQKERNKAWDMVGPPSKFMKRTAVTMVTLWLIIYIFLTMVIVLADHQMELEAKGGGTAAISGFGGPKKVEYLFINEMIPGLNPKQARPLYFWLIITGGLVLAIAVYGFQISGAENMKRLEKYGLCMAAALIGTFTINLFCLWALLVLMDKKVKTQFEISKRRAEGLIGEKLYEGLEGKEEEEEDEDEDDEEED